jgi:hypothetical protein
VSTRNYSTAHILGGLPIDLGSRLCYHLGRRITEERSYEEKFMVFVHASPIGVWKILEPEVLSKTAEGVKTAFLNCFSTFRRRYMITAFLNVRGK